MRSSYKPIGNYIRLVDERNNGLHTTNLLGVSISKQFIKSVANVIGTDMENYKIIRKNQFACSIMQVRRDRKMPVALYTKDEPSLISQAYPVFEIINSEELLPEYLMMWFTRSEFDREACFYAVGGVRGSLEWEDFCNMQLPIPSLEKQLEIVREYNFIQNRIKLNNQIIATLEETTQTIYKQWFVDFEFPNENGLPYKSNGGEMVGSELGVIPKMWSFETIQKLIDKNILFPNQDGNHGEIHPKSSDFVTTGIPFIMANNVKYGTVDLKSCSFISEVQSSKLRIGFSKTGDVLLTHKASMGRVAIVPKLDKYIILTPQVTYYRVKDQSQITKEFLYCCFNSYEFQKTFIGESEQSTRSYMGIISQRLLKILLPTPNIILNFSEIVKQMIKHKELIIIELNFLNDIQELLLSKMTKPEICKEFA